MEYIPRVRRNHILDEIDELVENRVMEAPVPLPSIRHNVLEEETLNGTLESYLIPDIQDSIKYK